GTGGAPGREGGDHRLPRADVARAGPRHRDRPSEVGADLGERPWLPGGEGERQPGDPRPDVGVRRGEPWGLRVLLPARATLGEPELEREQLVEREAPATFDEPC